MLKANLKNLFVALILSLVMVCTAAGRTIYVDDDGPADFNNIQAAIDDSSHGDIIVVSPGTYTGDGNRDIDYNGKAITVRSIDPNDPNIVAATVIDCNGTKEEPHRGFFFNAGEEASSVLDGLTITNGYAVTGGGICCEASRPTIANCVISGNTGGGIHCGLVCYLTGPSPPPPPPPPPPGPGGAESSPEILSDVNLSNVTITNCIFSENRGGGMHIVECNATVIDCIFSKNLGSGMGIYRSNANLVNCIFSENSSGYGGGMYNFESSLTLTNCTFSGNSAREGGGICNFNDSNMTLSNCTFNENSAHRGGGTCNKDSSLKLTDCKFNNNLADHFNGGGIYCEDGTPTITNCAFTDNTSNKEGGGIYIYREQFIPPPPPGPFSLLAEQSSPELMSDTNVPGPAITNCTFTGNSAHWGGGLVIDEPKSIVVNCIFTHNSAEWGGGMSNSGDNTSLIRCIFRDNSAQHSGGGMSNTASHTLLTGCVFRNNSVKYRGGGISNLSNSDITLTNSIFTGNTANKGGGMYNNLVLDAVLLNCAFTGNRAGEYGGGMYNKYSTTRLVNSTYSGNWAGGEGGAIWWDRLHPSSPSPPGPPPPGPPRPFVPGGSTIGESLEISDFNLNYDIDPMITNCVFWDNTDSSGMDDSPQISVDLYETPIIISYTCIRYWAGFLGNIDADPAFVEPGYWADPNDPNIVVGPDYPNAIWLEGDYHLLPISPCIDAGDPNYEPEPDETDLDGEPRIIGGRIDMGAYEHPGPRQTRLLYVDDDANGANNGLSWADAYNYLRDALAAVGSGDEIRVAQGVYKPDQGVGITAGDREATFQLRSGVTIEGGYAGFGAQEPNERDIELYETVLSGDLNGDDVDVVDQYMLTRAENSYHVITGSLTDTTAVLDGFTVIAGNANADWEGPDSMGGAVFNDSGNPKISNCTFSGNRAHGGGGAAYNVFGSPKFENCIFKYNGSSAMYNCNSNPELIDCTFIGNSSPIGGGMSNEHSELRLTRCSFFKNLVLGMYHAAGGGMYNINSNLTLISCAFEQNWVYVYRGVYGRPWAADGGGMYNTCSNLTLLNCIFIGNSAWDSGGIPDWGSSTALTDSAFTAITSENLAAGMYGILSTSIPSDWQFEPPTSRVSGGAIHNNDSLASIRNCTFAGNSARSGNALACYSFDQKYPSNTNLTNCILRDGGSELWRNSKSTIKVTYSDVQGSWPGNGNIDVDPQFVDPGYWADKNDPNIVVEPNDPDAIWVEGNYHLLAGSPCIDTGDPNYVPEPNETDLDGNPRIIGARVDMGAYEFFNTPPVGDAGPDQTVEAQAPWGATVTLDGSGSSDADSTPGTNDDIAHFDWYKVDACDPNFEDFLGSGEIIDCNLPLGEHIIILEVFDKAGAFDIDELTIFVEDTTLPVFTNIPQDLILECDGSYNEAELNGWLASAAAVDECGSVTITNDFAGILNECGATGSATVTWTAEDESGNTATTPPATFTIVDTTPPVIICPSDVTLECPADTSVEANGSATAGDTCGTVSITHSDQWQPGCGNTGTLTRMWTATDECGNSSSCAQTISVVDTTPPEFALSVSPTMLWPPNHKMVEITPTWTVSDECDASPDVSLISITMNEGDDTVGDGHTTNDIQIGDDGSIYLRAERSGAGGGRIYTINYQAIDDSGNATLRSATVGVPHELKFLARIGERWLWRNSGLGN